jgi:hypothetical protein
VSTAEDDPARDAERRVSEAARSQAAGADDKSVVTRAAAIIRNPLPVRGEEFRDIPDVRSRASEVRSWKHRKCGAL